jgi:hypothetical protein
MEPTTKPKQDEQSIHFDDSKLLSSLDDTLADALNLYQARPAPQQRNPRILFGESFARLRDFVGPAFKVLFPKTQKILDDLLKYI